jgi:hypothetical protein
MLILNDCKQQIFLAGNIVIKRSLAHAEALAYVSDRGAVVASFVENICSTFYDFSPAGAFGGKSVCVCSRRT